MPALWRAACHLPGHVSPMACNMPAWHLLVPMLAKSTGIRTVLDHRTHCRARQFVTFGSAINVNMTCQPYGHLPGHVSPMAYMPAWHLLVPMLAKSTGIRTPWTVTLTTESGVGPSRGRVTQILTRHYKKGPHLADITSATDQVTRNE
jgi:hypothetical protein